MRCFYRLQIVADNDAFLSISQVLGVDSTEPEGFWILELTEEASDPYSDPFNKFLDILEGKYEALAILGIQRSNISVWTLYEYDNQCNMEFLPREMKRLGENGIVLCVSCWDSGIED